MHNSCVRVRVEAVGAVVASCSCVFVYLSVRLFVFHILEFSFTCNFVDCEPSVCSSVSAVVKLRDCNDALVLSLGRAPVLDGAEG